MPLVNKNHIELKTLTFFKNIFKEDDPELNVKMNKQLQLTSGNNDKGIKLRQWNKEERCLESP
jgi:hypothetical protein